MGNRDIYLKIYGQPVINISKNNGYIFELMQNSNWTKYYENLYTPSENNNYNELYTEEVNIINKIKNNKEGYFNFSKEMLDIGANVYVYSFMLHNIFPIIYFSCFYIGILCVYNGFRCFIVTSCCVLKNTIVNS